MFVVQESLACIICKVHFHNILTGRIGIILRLLLIHRLAVILHWQMGISLLLEHLCYSICPSDKWLHYKPSQQLTLWRTSHLKVSKPFQLSHLDTFQPKNLWSLYKLEFPKKELMVIETFQRFSLTFGSESSSGQDLPALIWGVRGPGLGKEKPTTIHPIKDPPNTNDVISNKCLLWDPESSLDVFPAGFSGSFI